MPLNADVTFPVPKMTHPKALENMKAKTLSALQGCTVKERWPVFSSYTAYVSKLADEAIKQRKEWLTSSNVYSIFLSEVTAALAARFPEEAGLEGNLADLLGADGIATLADRICSIVLSVPRSYVFRFPLPNVEIPIDGQLQLGEGISLRTFEENEEIPSGEGGGLLGFGKYLARNKFYLCIEEIGFTSGDNDDIAFSHALSKFKIMTHLLLLRGTFSERTISPILLYGLGGRRHYVPNLVSTIFDTEKPNEVHATALLPIGISRQTDKLCLNKENKTFQKAESLGHEGLAVYLQSMSNQPVLLLSHKGPDSVPIQSAIEWAYEASTTDNDTIAFLQVCIGLEAILGDETASESISATLADRCAYLLGNDIQGRRTIRENFRELYKRRSKLAHGRAIRLEPEEWKYFNWGKSILNHLIMKEIKHLNLGKA